MAGAVVTTSSVIPTCSCASTVTTTSTVYTRPVTSTGYTAPLYPTDDPRVGWIHELSKQQLMVEMARHQLPSHGTLAELRKRLCTYWRSNAGTSSSPTSQEEVLTTGQVLDNQARTSMHDTTPRPSPFDYRTGSIHHPTAWRPPGTYGLVGLPPATFQRQSPPAAVTSAPHELSFAGQEDVTDAQHTFDSAQGSLPREYPFEDPIHRSLDRIRQMLGLSTNADLRSMEHTLAEVLNLERRGPRTHDADYAEPPANEMDQLTSRYAVPSRTNDVYGGVRSSYVLRSHDLHEDVAKTSSALCDKVRKWNLRFDGRRDAVSFLERLEELREAYSLSPEDVLKALPSLLHGQALLWYRNNKMMWRSFHDFRRAFEVQFFPAGYHRHLDDEIRKRTQGETEAFKDFVIALTTLIRRSGTFSNQETIDLVYLNMRPEYKFMIRRHDFVTLPDLIERADEYEELLRERKLFRPPPPVAQALVPETAYTPRRRMDRFVDVAVMEYSEPDCKLQPTSPKTGRTGDYPARSGGNQARHTTPTVPNHMRQGLPSTSPSRSSSNRNPPVCWNCDARGHVFRDCNQPKVLRCYYCKQVGVATTSCGCLLVF
ncbi:uncharacterized protein LOC128994182 [Macrosteles quadrilineatus]|uniref:uncharacterized protein LOC128994182 n=1 Tax=Macrosteles quadrilineatus TaxID=74068 RepID=UPI0023E31DD8|nr:uncharacterized protein LOC128994182 [Macrosteles quadrilineatus]XP_054274528.1 uncharacterized protein LOC128994182 [Macrosteles quadrilineatus]